MNIIETDIPDVTHENIKKSKIKLADHITDSIKPIISNMINENSTQITKLEKEELDKRKVLLKKKDTIENLLKIYTKKKKTKMIIEKIDFLVTSGLIKENSIKQEMVTLLKVIDSLSEERLDRNYKNIVNIMDKRYSKN